MSNTENVQALTTQERSFLYRLNKREILGDKEFKLQQAAKKRAYRLRKTENKQKLLDRIVKRKLLQKSKKEKFINKLKDISRNTAEFYTNNLIIIHNGIFKKQIVFNNLKWLNDTSKVINYLKDKYKSVNSYSTMINSITGITKHFKNYKTAYDEYSKENLQGIKQKLESLMDNKLTENEKKNFLEWGEILKSKPKTSLEKLIFSLYTDNPPVRGIDYRLLKLEFEDTEDISNNILVDYGGFVKKIVITKYKTNESYGTYEITNPKILDTVQKYLEDEDVSINDYIFKKTKTNEPISQPRYTKLLQDTFKRLTGKKLSTNLLRHSYISYRKKNNMTIREEKQLAYDMKHSRAMQSMYNRI